MVRACSDDLRRRVVAAVEGGMSCRGAALRFGVAPSSSVKWTQRFRQTGSVSPRPRTAVRRSVLNAHRDWLLARIGSEPHVTLHRLASELTERGTPVSHNAVWLWLRRNGLTHKKRPAGRGAGPR